ncbi:hypothetical protein [Undibacterium sp. SXout20W]|uniref:hypothetical protein n=1 Tax=Undibacterium sp. SXout20W TaxID=3413051 RepID=UPI003BF0F079
MVTKAKSTKTAPAKRKVSDPNVAWPFPTEEPVRKTTRNASPSMTAPKAKLKDSPKNAKAEVAVTNKPVHSVKATLTNLELAKAKSALTLDLFANKSKLGTLEVGSGSFYWTGRNRQKSKRIDWSTFAELMNKLAYPVD